MSVLRALVSLLGLAGLSWDDINPRSSAANHGHPWGDIGMDLPSLVQLAEALGGGIYPGMGSGQNDTVSAVDSVAPNFPLNMNFLLAANQVKLQAVKLSFQPQAFRTYVTGSTGAGSLHQHVGDIVQSLSITIDTGTGHRHRLFSTSSGAPAPMKSFNYQNSSTNNKLVGLQADALEDIWSDTNTDATVAGGTTGHYHTNPTHTHAPTNTGGEQVHTHSPTNGVQEGTSPDAMRVLVDGTDVTTQLGGPFNSAQTELDVTPYVAPGTGQHVVQVTTTTNLGRIAGFLRHKGIFNNLSPAT